MSQAAVAAWKDTTMPHQMSMYTQKGILNIDQYGLFYSHDMLHNKANTFKGKSFERHALIRMVLRSSHLVYESTQQWCFKSIKSLPCTYHHNEATWKTGKISLEFTACLRRSTALKKCWWEWGEDTLFVVDLHTQMM